MSVVFGLLPALSIDKHVRLDRYVLCPASEVTTYNPDKSEAKMFQELAAMYAVQHKVSADDRAICVQLHGSKPGHINIPAATGAVNCLAFAATCAGRKHMSGGGYHVLGHPDYFHVSPITPTVDGSGFVYHTSWTLGSANRAENIPHPWPVDSPSHSRMIRWDENLLSALGPVLKRITKRAPHAESLRIIHSITLMNHATAGFGELIPGHADQARHIAFAVSSMETMCNTGQRDANRKRVITEVDRLPFSRRRLTGQRFQWTFDKKAKRPLMTGRAGRVVLGAYEARNDYLHGNEIRPGVLHYRKSPRRPLLLEPLLIVFRKLVVKKCLPFGGLDLDEPQSRSCEGLSLKRSVRVLLEFIEHNGRVRIEREYDDWLARLLGR